MYRVVNLVRALVLLVLLLVQSVVIFTRLLVRSQRERVAGTALLYVRTGAGSAHFNAVEVIYAVFGTVTGAEST